MPVLPFRRSGQPRCLCLINQLLTLRMRQQCEKIYVIVIIKIHNIVIIHVFNANKCCIFTLLVVHCTAQLNFIGPLNGRLMSSVFRPTKYVGPICLPHYHKKKII